MDYTNILAQKFKKEKLKKTTTQNVDVHMEPTIKNVDVHTVDYHTKPRKTIRLTQESWNKLEKLSKQLGITSLSETIKYLIDRKL